MTWIDYVILGVVAVVFGGIVAYLVSSKRKNKGGCGCGCNGCPHANSCSTASRDEEER